MLKNDRGQNTIELILLVVCVVVVMIFFLNPKNGPFKRKLEDSLNTVATGQIGSITQEFKNDIQRPE